MHTVDTVRPFIGHVSKEEIDKAMGKETVNETKQLKKPSSSKKKVLGKESSSEETRGR